MSYKRILLKISGEALYNGGEKYDETVFIDICNTLKNIRKENSCIMYRWNGNWWC